MGGDAARGEGAEDDAMMRIARFSMDAELAPFLRGEVRIFDMRIEEPRITVELDEEGAIDWAERAESALPDANVVLERVTVDNGHVTVEDRQNGRVHEISDVDAVISADALTGPWRVSGTAARGEESAAFSVTTGRLGADGGISVTTRLLPDSRPVSLELDGSARIVDGKPRYGGNFVLQVLNKVASAEQPPAGEPPAAAALRGTGRFEAESDRLRVPEYRLEVGAAADPYVVTGEGTIDIGPEPEFLLIADGQQIDVDRFGAGPAAAAEGAAEEPAAEEPVSIAERVATFRQVMAQIPIPDLPGRVSLNLPAVIAGGTTLREVSVDAAPENGEAWRVNRFSAALPGRTQVEASGLLSLGGDFGFSGDLVVASSQPSGLAAWLTDNVPAEIRGLSAAGFEAQVDLTDRLQRLDDLELAVGEATLSGRFERVADGGKPSLSFDLAGDDFDLDALSALAGLVTEGTAGSGLAGHDVAARLRAGRFTAAGIGMGDVEAAFTYRDGLLDIERLAVGNIAGAAVDGYGVFSDLTGAPQGRAQFTLAVDDPADVLALAESRASGAVDLSHFRRNAALFRDTDLRFDLQLGSARDEPGDASGGYDLQIAGEAGGSAVSLSLSSDASMADWTSAGIEAAFSAEHPRSDHLMAQMGLPVLPFDIGGPMTLTLDIDGRLHETAAFDAAVSAPGLQLTASGDAAYRQARLAGGAFALSLDAEDLEPYLILAGLGLPGLGTGLPAGLTADVAFDEEQWSIAGLEGSVGENAFAGNLLVSRDAVPEVTGALDLDVLDIPWLAETLAGEPLVSPETGAWSEREFLAAAPAPFSAEIDIEASRALLGLSEPAERVTTTLSFDNGLLRLADLSADWLGGTLSADAGFGLSNDAGILRVQARLDDAFLTRALADLPELSPISGRVGLALSVEGSGKSPEAITGALSGSAAARLTDLKIAGLDQDALNPILAGADADGFVIEEDSVRELALEALSSGLFAVDRAAIPLTIAGGVVRASNIVLENHAAALSGGGSVALSDLAVDADFELAFEAGDETLPGATPAVDLSLSGPLAAPQRELSATDLSNFLSLRAYERERRRVERVQAAVLEKQRLRREAAMLRADIAARAAAREAESERLAREAERQAEEAARRAAEDATGEEEAPEEAEEVPEPEPEPSPPPAPPLPDAVPDIGDAGEGAAIFGPQPPALDFDSLPGVQMQP